MLPRLLSRFFFHVAAWYLLERSSHYYCEIRMVSVNIVIRSQLVHKGLSWGQPWRQDMGYHLWVQTLVWFPLPFLSVSMGLCYHGTYTSIIQYKSQHFDAACNFKHLHCSDIFAQLWLGGPLNNVCIFASVQIGIHKTYNVFLRKNVFFMSDRITWFF